MAWALATLAFTLLLPVFGVTRSAGAAFALVAAAALLGPSLLALLSAGERPEPLRRGFAAVNGVALVVMILVCADALR